MDNNEILAQMEDLFAPPEAEEQTPEETPETEPTEPEEPAAEEPAEESEAEETEGEQNQEPDRKQQKSNQAFAQLRTQNKQMQDTLKKLGEAFGIEVKGENLDSLIETINQAALAKQAKEQNVPVELLQRLEVAEKLVADNERMKLESTVKDNLLGLTNKYKLSSDQLDEFINYLNENNLNPLTYPDVNIESEYLKLHFEDIVQARIDAAMQGEKERQQNVAEHAGSGLPGKGGESDTGEGKIETVKDFEKAMASWDL